MSSERQKILEMLENGRITAEEAAQLLECLPDEGGGKLSRSVGVSTKKLRVKVDGMTEKDKNINVNVSIPLSLARLADNIIENCIPTSALDEMKKQGVDLKALRLGDMLGTLETLEEDIVDADIVQDDANFKVRVYVE